MQKKLRNRLIALFCLCVFVAGGALYYTSWVVPKPFAVILLVSDGLTPSMLTPARLYKNGASARLALEGLPHVAVVSTHGNDFAVPDSASAATMIAAGKKVNHRAVGVDGAGRPLATLADLARDAGRSVGLVTNAALADATPAAFYAKTSDPLDHSAIALQLVESGKFDVILGGGEADFLPESKGGTRADGRDLLLELRRQGFDLVRERGELEMAPAWRAQRLFGAFASGNLDFAEAARRGTTQPSLADLVRQAILVLQYNPKGYLLVVDAGLVSKACQTNDGERALQEILEMDRALATALQYAGDDALVVATGKQSVGGMRMNGHPFTNDRGVSLLGMNPRGMPSLTWSTGPGGFRDSPDEPVEPSAFQAPVAVGVAEDVLAVGTGPGAGKISGFVDNTDIFRVIRDSL